MKTQLQLLPSLVAGQPLVTVTHTAAEVAFCVGARSVSWYHSAHRPGPAFAGEAAAFAADVARATAAEVVQMLVDLLDPELPTCHTVDVAEMEAHRMEQALVDAATTGHPRSLRLRGAALSYAAATLRRRAVAW